MSNRYTERPMCKHCKERVVCRPRGLCWNCYHSPARKSYPVKIEGYNGRVVSGGPCEPTDAIPGSEEKIRVLAQRVKSGQELWHPLDNRTLPDSTGGLHTGGWSKNSITEDEE